MELTATSQCSTLHEIVDWEVKKSEPKLSLAFPVISQIIHVFNLYCKCFFLYLPLSGQNCPPNLHRKH